MSQLVTAQLRYLRTSPRKLRILVDYIRGKKAVRAVNDLSVLNKQGAEYLSKLVKSAIANAKHNHELDADNLFIKTITVDGGPVLKRFMPKAHGRATPVRERTAHVKLALGLLPEKEKNGKKITKS
ncbi:MAG: 50S ribosomal protein L22 [Candidatus Magasanikbacteria bacterium GW2011_GWA2_50_22]|uniref:Large ribosomal subunit protein uL22 n=1 Tax=Candidatus Magasanikbacteria bacterium GW2011_GWA2_50_22 TaxID=1619043 RepID=A0A0G1ZEH5_9BACT|nr:MAG: 50S ribosomal protein L22 [Candidatus Magasanikbacteria bacterium GW2011_GWA2_50_22]